MKTLSTEEMKLVAGGAKQTSEPPIADLLERLFELIRLPAPATFNVTLRVYGPTGPSF
jgi:hypothetical protein